MNTYRRSTRTTIGLAAIALTAGLGTGTLGNAEPASAATTMAGTGCNESSRLFQLRAGGTELWYASINQANLDNPTVYSWRKIYDIPKGKAESVTAHASNPDSKGVHLVLSDEHGALRTLNYNKTEGKITLDQTIAPGTATNPGNHRYTSLTSDGDKLYGTRGGKLYVMTSISVDKAPEGTSVVTGVSGMWPQAFYGNPAGDFDIAWTDSNGKLTYGDVRSTAPGKWEITDRNVVQQDGYSSKAITSPGGGILLRSDGTNLHRYKSTPTDISGRKTIKTGWNVNNSNPITTVPDVCRTAADTSAYSLPLERNAVPRSEYDDPHHDYPAIDFAVPTGTRVLAMRGGTVTHVDGGCGLGIQVTADDGGTYLYCHLSSRSVANGSTVKTGQYLGPSGNTGNSTGPHLHVQIKTGGTPRCPQPMLLDIYDGKTPPSPTSLPTSGCSY